MPLDLTVYNDRQWATTDEDLEYIGDRLNTMHHTALISETRIKKLNRASPLILQAALLGSKEEGLYKPK